MSGQRLWGWTLVLAGFVVACSGQDADEKPQNVDGELQEAPTEPAAPASPAEDPSTAPPVDDANQDEVPPEAPPAKPAEAEPEGEVSGLEPCSTISCEAGVEPQHYPWEGSADASAMCFCPRELGAR
jgi:hypothetical protein